MNRAARFGLFALLFVAASVPIYLMTALAELARPGAIFTGARVWSRLFLWLARLLLGIGVRIEGAPPPGAAIVAAKHQSVFETIALLRLLENPAIVLKRELLRVPLWPFFAARHGAIPVDRDEGPVAMRAMVRSARRAVAEGRRVLIFPEGTRVAPGEAPPLKPGALALYGLLGVPLVPLALDTAFVWPRTGWPRPGVARLRFLPPIPPGGPRAGAEATLHRAINALEPEAALA